MTAAPARDYARLGDLELAALIAARDPGAVRHLTTACNQRLFRAAWAILKDRAEAEESVQESYLKAFRGIAGFTGGASLSTWLTRIAVNEALQRRRAAQRRTRALGEAGVAVLDDYREALMAGSRSTPSPEAALMRREAGRLLERAVAALPESFRPVFVLRELEGLSVEETAEALSIPPATVKTRLLRARRQLREALDPDLRAVFSETAGFAGADCAAMTARVLAAMGL